MQWALEGQPPPTSSSSSGGRRNSSAPVLTSGKATSLLQAAAEVACLSSKAFISTLHQLRRDIPGLPLKLLHRRLERIERTVKLVALQQLQQHSGCGTASQHSGCGTASQHSAIAAQGAAVAAASGGICDADSGGGVKPTTLQQQQGQQQQEQQQQQQEQQQQEQQQRHCCISSRQWSHVAARGAAAGDMDAAVASGAAAAAACGGNASSAGATATGGARNPGRVYSSISSSTSGAKRQASSSFNASPIHQHQQQNKADAGPSPRAHGLKRGFFGAAVHTPRSSSSGREGGLAEAQLQQGGGQQPSLLQWQGGAQVIGHGEQQAEAPESDSGSNEEEEDDSWDDEGYEEEEEEEEEDDDGDEEGYDGSSSNSRSGSASQSHKGTRRPFSVDKDIDGGGDRDQNHQNHQQQQQHGQQRQQQQHQKQPSHQQHVGSWDADCIGGSGRESRSGEKQQQGEEDAHEVLQMACKCFARVSTSEWLHTFKAAPGMSTSAYRDFLYQQNVAAEAAEAGLSEEDPAYLVLQLLSEHGSEALLPTGAPAAVSYALAATELRQVLAGPGYEVLALTQLGVHAQFLLRAGRGLDGGDVGKGQLLSDYMLPWAGEKLKGEGSITETSLNALIVEVLRCVSQSLASTCSSSSNGGSSGGSSTSSSSGGGANSSSAGEAGAFPATTSPLAPQHHSPALGTTSSGSGSGSGTSSSSTNGGSWHRCANTTQTGAGLPAPPLAPSPQQLTTAPISTQCLPERSGGSDWGYQPTCQLLSLLLHRQVILFQQCLWFHQACVRSEDCKEVGAAAIVLLAHMDALPYWSVEAIAPLLQSLQQIVQLSREAQAASGDPRKAAAVGVKLLGLRGQMPPLALRSGAEVSAGMLEWRAAVRNSNKQRPSPLKALDRAVAVVHGSIIVHEAKEQQLKQEMLSQVTQRLQQFQQQQEQEQQKKQEQQESHEQQCSGGSKRSSRSSGTTSRVAKVAVKAVHEAQLKKAQCSSLMDPCSSGSTSSTTSSSSSCRDTSGKGGDQDPDGGAVAQASQLAMGLLAYVVFDLVWKYHYQHQQHLQLRKHAAGEAPQVLETLLVLPQERDVLMQQSGTEAARGAVIAHVGELLAHWRSSGLPMNGPCYECLQQLCLIHCEALNGKDQQQQQQQAGFMSAAKLTQEQQREYCEATRGLYGCVGQLTALLDSEETLQPQWLRKQTHEWLTNRRQQQEQKIQPLEGSLKELHAFTSYLFKSFKLLQDRLLQVAVGVGTSESVAAAAAAAAAAAVDKDMTVEYTPPSGPACPVHPPRSYLQRITSSSCNDEHSITNSSSSHGGGRHSSSSSSMTSSSSGGGIRSTSNRGISSSSGQFEGAAAAGSEGAGIEDVLRMKGGAGYSPAPSTDGGSSGEEEEDTREQQKQQQGQQQEQVAAEGEAEADADDLTLQSWGSGRVDEDIAAACDAAALSASTKTKQSSFCFLKGLSQHARDGSCAAASTRQPPQSSVLDTVGNSNYSIGSTSAAVIQEGGGAVGAARGAEKAIGGNVPAAGDVVTQHYTSGVGSVSAEHLMLGQKMKEILGQQISSSCHKCSTVGGSGCTAVAAADCTSSTSSAAMASSSWRGNQCSPGSSSSGGRKQAAAEQPHPQQSEEEGSMPVRGSGSLLPVKTWKDITPQQYAGIRGLLQSAATAPTNSSKEGLASQAPSKAGPSSSTGLGTAAFVTSSSSNTSSGSSRSCLQGKVRDEASAAAAAAGAAGVPEAPGTQAPAAALNPTWTPWAAKASAAGGGAGVREAGVGKATTSRSMASSGSTATRSSWRSMGAGGLSVMPEGLQQALNSISEEEGGGDVGHGRAFQSRGAMTGCSGLTTQGRSCSAADGSDEANPATASAGTTAGGARASAAAGAEAAAAVAEGLIGIWEAVEYLAEQLAAVKVARGRHEQAHKELLAKLDDAAFMKAFTSEPANHKQRQKNHDAQRKLSQLSNKSLTLVHSSKCEQLKLRQGMGYFAQQRYGLKAALGPSWVKKFATEGPLYESDRCGLTAVAREWYDDVSSSSSAWNFWKEVDTLSATSSSSTTDSRAGKDQHKQQQGEWRGEESMLGGIGTECRVVEGPLGAAIPEVLLRGAAAKNSLTLPARIRQALLVKDWDNVADLSQLLGDEDDEQAFDLGVEEEIQLGQQQQGACMFTALQLMLKVGLLEETWVVEAPGSSRDCNNRASRDGSRGRGKSSSGPGSVASSSSSSSNITQFGSSSGGHGVGYEAERLIVWPDEDSDVWPGPSAAAAAAGPGAAAAGERGKEARAVMDLGQQQQQKPVGLKGLLRQLFELPKDKQAQVIGLFGSIILVHANLQCLEACVYSLCICSCMACLH